MTASANEFESLKFEEALSRLEELVTKMESGKLPLENLISDYETGSRLLAVCRARLATMERKIQILSHDDGKTGEWHDFTPDTPPRGAGGELPF